MTEQMRDNPDRAIISAAMKNGQTNYALETCQLLRDLSCRVLEAKSGQIEVSYVPTDRHVQGFGLVCGGVIATMLDYSMALAALTTCNNGESAFSVGLNVAFLAPVPQQLVRIDATLLTNGYRLVHAQAQLMDKSGKILATASSPLHIKRIPKPISQV